MIDNEFVKIDMVVELIKACHQRSNLTSTHSPNKANKIRDGIQVDIEQVINVCGSHNNTWFDLYARNGNLPLIVTHTVAKLQESGLVELDINSNTISVNASFIEKFGDTL